MNAAAVGSSTGQPLHGPEPVDFQTRLIAALTAQTEALNRLAASNESLSQAVATLIDEMAQADGSDEAPRTYMDGSPAR